jgi:hypothetical protein
MLDESRPGVGIHGFESAYASDRKWVFRSHEVLVLDGKVLAFGRRKIKGKSGIRRDVEIVDAASKVLQPAEIGRVLLGL